MGSPAEGIACGPLLHDQSRHQFEERGLVERVAGIDDRRVAQLTEAGHHEREDMSDAVATRALVLRRLGDAQRKALRPWEALLTEDSRPQAAERRGLGTAGQHGR